MNESVSVEDAMLTTTEGGLVGGWFWWDECERLEQRAIYHGQIVAYLGNQYYLIRYDDTSVLPKNVHEVEHIGQIAGNHWSIYLTEEDLRGALGG
jgi:hypothetical protein